uniref:Uncharacterized protein n=1 Tax=Rhizophora mucronata TaxID=61149 RepID=A0A2P2MFS7_RHIMU
MKQLFTGNKKLSQ